MAGHGRLNAAKLLGMEQVPTIRLDQMTEAQKRAFVIADNKLAENAGWDRKLLALELQYVCELDIDFDLTTTGFETGEIDVLLGEIDADGIDGLDQLPELDHSEPPVSCAGDLSSLGPHRVLCADSREKESFDRLFRGTLAQMAFIDPPYNVPIDGHVSGLGAIRHPEFAMASGEMPPQEFITFLQTAFGHSANHSINGSIHFICMDWRHLLELLTAGQGVYSELKNLCVWNKNNGGMGSLYRSKHELVFVFKAGSGPHINNVDLGRHGRNRTNVWDYAGVNTLREGRLEELAMHPTVKPVALVADAILDCSKRGGLVLDCFGGAGTTLIAAQKTGRRAYLIELDPIYVDVTIRRFEKITREKAVHADTGLGFAHLEKQRREQAGGFASTQNGGERDGR